jgi:hypothetical protein
MAIGNEGTSSDYFKELSDKIEDYRKGGLTTFLKDIALAATSLESYGAEVNRTFGQTRQSITEIKTALSDALPGIDRLGGNIRDVQVTISQVSEATRRNVIATTDQTEKLYAAFKVTNVSVKDLVSNFADVGVGVGQMTKQIENSIQYIQSIGGNAKQVFGVVTDNMDKLNRYQFEGGVQGLTKMAAQASMLRFDMRTTFDLAENLYKPERAVEVAAAFQRLGLAVGDLGDPFRLMSDSINNPQGLQDSLVKVAESMAYFDTQTKTFKINPEGVIRLKELQEQTGVSATEMMKLGLSAKEAQARISAISSVGLNVKEEDKQLLSNISRMGDGGEFEIQMKDSQTGERRWEKLTSISQDQLNATLKEQKEGPKTLEDIARSQLDYGERTAGDVRAIYHGLTYGFAGERRVSETVEGINRLTDTLVGTASKMFGTSQTGKKLGGAVIDDVQQLIKDARDPKKGATEAMASFLERANNQINQFGDSFKGGFIEYLNKVSDKVGEKTGIEGGTKILVDKLLGDKRTPGTAAGQEMPSTYSNLMGRTEPIDLTRRGVNQPTNEVINVKYSFEPLEVRITGDNGKLDVTEIQTQINKTVTTVVSNLPPTMIMNPQQFYNPTKTGPITSPYTFNNYQNNQPIKKYN